MKRRVTARIASRTEPPAYLALTEEELDAMTDPEPESADDRAKARLAKISARAEARLAEIAGAPEYAGLVLDDSALPNIADGITDAEAEASATLDLTIDEVRESDSMFRAACLAATPQLAWYGATAGQIENVVLAVLHAALPMHETQHAKAWKNAAEQRTHFELESMKLAEQLGAATTRAEKAEASILEITPFRMPTPPDGSRVEALTRELGAYAEAMAGWREECLRRRAELVAERLAKESAEGENDRLCAQFAGLGKPTTEWGIQRPGEDAQEHCGFSETRLLAIAEESDGHVVERTAYRGPWRPADDTAGSDA